MEEGRRGARKYKRASSSSSVRERELGCGGEGVDDGDSCAVGCQASSLFRIL